MAEQDEGTSKKTSQSASKKASKKAPKKTTQKTTKQAPRKSSSGASAPRAQAPRRRSGLDIAEAASRELGQLTGKQIEAVTGLERTDDGWRVEVEVLELNRVPNTTDVLATYDVALDSDGELEGYRRGRRYVRGTPGEDDR